MPENPSIPNFMVKRQIWKCCKNRHVHPHVDVEAFFDTSFVLNRCWHLRKWFGGTFIFVEKYRFFKQCPTALRVDLKKSKNRASYEKTLFTKVSAVWVLYMWNTTKAKKVKQKKMKKCIRGSVGSWNQFVF